MTNEYDLQRNRHRPPLLSVSVLSWTHTHTHRPVVHVTCGSEYVITDYDEQLNIWTVNTERSISIVRFHSQTAQAHSHS